MFNEHPGQRTTRAILLKFRNRVKNEACTSILGQELELEDANAVTLHLLSGFLVSLVYFFTKLMSIRCVEEVHSVSTRLRLGYLP